MEYFTQVSQLIISICASCATLTIGIVGIFIGYLYNRRLLKNQQYDDERKEIYKKLNSFYGPLIQLLDISTELYGRFTYQRDPEFRTLIALLEGEKFEGNDKILLEQIFDITNRINNLILANSGLVDNDELRSILSKTSAHYRILHLAYEGNLKGEKERFAEYTFPRELRPKVEQQITTLQARLDELNKM